jgi:hypothetical protein
MKYKSKFTFWGLLCVAFVTMSLVTDSINTQQADFKMLDCIPFRNNNNHDDFFFPNPGQSIYQFQFVVKKSAVGFERLEIMKVDGSKEEFVYRYKLLDEAETHIFTLNRPNVKVAKVRVWHTIRHHDKRNAEVELWGK